MAIVDSMSEELSFTLNGKSSIFELMDALRARFHKEFRGRTVTKYVIEPGKKYLLIVNKGQGDLISVTEGLTVAILLQQAAGYWIAQISPERPWNQEVTFFAGEKDLLEQIKSFFLEERGDILSITKAWTNSSAKGEQRKSDDDYVTPFYSELSEAGTVVRCPKCGAAEIIFPNSRNCSRCGAEIIRKETYPELPEAEKGAVAQPPAGQSGSAEVGICAVCGMRIKPGESLAYCPQCAASAHRAHFLEYLHVKGQCPSCHDHLSEKELSDKPPLQRVARSRQDHGKPKVAKPYRKTHGK
jgi:predicted RNA-binding Zn-ribbon protein involved in translation (DUF1610 family)